MAKKRIGEVLLERKAITQEQLEAALAEQKRTRKRLGATLIDRGIITEAQLAAVLAESLGLSAVDLQVVTVDWSAVHLLRARFCEQHELFPFSIDGKGTPQQRLVVAMADPLNQPALDEIEFTTGLGVLPRIATHSQIRAAILRYYHKEGAGPAGHAPPALAPAHDEAEVVVMGEEIISQANAMPPAAPPRVVDPGLEQLIAQRQSQATAKKKKGDPLLKDLDVLFGGRAEDDDAVEKLTHKFWALMRIMARKGLITREEFQRELDEE